MNQQSIREIFDNISLSVISFLENHIGITDVEFVERQGKKATIIPNNRCSRSSNHKMGRREHPVHTPRRLQGVSPNLRWPRPELEDQEK